MTTRDEAMHINVDDGRIAETPGTLIPGLLFL